MIFKAGKDLKKLKKVEDFSFGQYHAYDNYYNAYINLYEKLNIKRDLFSNDFIYVE